MEAHGTLAADGYILGEFIARLKLYSVFAYCRVAFFPNERLILPSSSFTFGSTYGGMYRDDRVDSISRCPGGVACAFPDNPVDICR